MNWPHNKEFAFTIVDDTDGGTVFNLEPVYQLLIENEIITTKTVWCYPPKDDYAGQSLGDDKYFNFIQYLQDNKFEISLYSIGSGRFTRDEIRKGLDFFESKIGYKPNIQINHASNIDSIYWGYKRFRFPVKHIYKYLISSKKYLGDEINSDCYWLDQCNNSVKYMRNHVFNEINTLKIDKWMPYIDKCKPGFNGCYFSSSNAENIFAFNNLVNKESIDKLKKEKGLSIIYTHFGKGFVNKQGHLNKEFKKNIEYLSKQNGWFVPASDILNHLQQEKQRKTLSTYAALWLDSYWLYSRIKFSLKNKTKALKEYYNEIVEISNIIKSPTIKINLHRNSIIDDNFYYEKITTFYNESTSAHNKFKVIPQLKYGVAVYSELDQKGKYYQSLNSSAKRNIKKCIKNSYTCKLIEFNDHLEDITKIRASSKVRQGRLVPKRYHSTLQPSHLPKSQNANLYGYQFFGVMKNNRVYAYASALYTGDVCIITSILGHTKHQSFGVIPLLISNVAQHFEENNTTKYMVYDTYFGATSTLKRFKRKFSFSPKKVKWLIN